MLVKWSAIRESGMRGGLEARLRRFDGEYRWFLFQAEPLRDVAGNIVKWYRSGADIEDRQLGAVARPQSEQRLFGSAPNPPRWLRADHPGGPSHPAHEDAAT